MDGKVMVFIFYREVSSSNPFGWRIKMEYHFDEALTRYWLIGAAIYFSVRGLAEF